MAVDYFSACREASLEALAEVSDKDNRERAPIFLPGQKWRINGGSSYLAKDGTYHVYCSIRGIMGFTVHPHRSRSTFPAGTTNVQSHRTAHGSLFDDGRDKHKKNKRS